MNWTKRTFITGLGASLILKPLFVGALPIEQFGIEYLEGLGATGALSDTMAYVPPSQIDPAYSHAIYVNTATRSDAGQKMWVLERAASGWKLALWDTDYWADRGSPAYSWPVSTGRKYAGERRTGPTPLGIFNVDDRTFRHRKGWTGNGMYNAIFIDLHYSGGRMSGVAMHGTPKSKYRLLGKADSHGCVRMRQGNADKMWDLFHGTGKPGQASPLWSEVPRFFTSAPHKDHSTRWNYTRDGSYHYDAAGERLTKPGYSALFVFFRDDL